MPGHGASMVQWKEPRFWRRYTFFLARRQQSMVVKSMHSGVEWLWSQCGFSHQNTTWAEPPRDSAPCEEAGAIPTKGGWCDKATGWHHPAPRLPRRRKLWLIFSPAFSRSSADLLGTSGYIFQNNCVCVLARHCELWTFQGKDVIKTNGKLFKASGFSSPKGSPGNMEGSVCIIFTIWTSLPRLLKKSHKKHLWLWVPQ